MRRVAFLALAWLLVIAVFGAIQRWSPQIPRPTPAAQAASALTRALNHVDRGQSGGRMPVWTVVSATSAHHVMVVDVEAARPDTARQIATQIVEPLRDRYEEVLVYFHKPGDAKVFPERRIQWTPRGGYVEAIYKPER
jgi:hypothetical protein